MVGRFLVTVTGGWPVLLLQLPAAASAWANTGGSSGLHRPATRGDVGIDAVRLSSTTTGAGAGMGPTEAVEAPDAPAARTVVARSRLTLLEHVNLNVPSQAAALDFYLGVLGLGLDPRKAGGVGDNTKTVWANGGVSQFHLPHGSAPQVIPGHLGLQYRSLDGLRRRVAEHPDLVQHVSDTRDGAGGERLELQDRCGNRFVCRAAPECRILTDPDRRFRPQPVVPASAGRALDAAGQELYDDEFRRKYGCDSPDCLGLHYVEFHCPMGSAAKIADFYQRVLGAAASVLSGDESGSDTGEGNALAVAVVAVGRVDDAGRSDQALVFRETVDPLPPYDGHHVALYVGDSAADFEETFLTCDAIGVVWVNPRFSDKADSLPTAREYRQFRFKDILDLDTGETVFELEHEMRSIEHEMWTGVISS